MKKLTILLTLILAACSYSDGDRAGQVVKLSRKGIGYQVIDGNPYFDSSCDCVAYRSALQPRLHEEFQKFLEQTQPAKE